MAESYLNCKPLGLALLRMQQILSQNIASCDAALLFKTHSRSKVVMSTNSEGRETFCPLALSHWLSLSLSSYLSVFLACVAAWVNMILLEHLQLHTRTHTKTFTHAHKEQWLVYLFWHWIETNTHGSLACVERGYYLLSTISRHLYLRTQRELLSICFNVSNLSHYSCQTSSPLSTCIIPAGSQFEKKPGLRYLVRLGWLTPSLRVRSYKGLVEQSVQLARREGTTMAYPATPTTPLAHSPLFRFCDGRRTTKQSGDQLIKDQDTQAQLWCSTPSPLWLIWRVVE